MTFIKKMPYYFKTKDEANLKVLINRQCFKVDMKYQKDYTYFV